MVGQRTVIYWFRRDLRLHDNHALAKAIESGEKVQPIFIFDENIISELPANDRRLSLIYNQLKVIHAHLAKIGGSLRIVKGDPKIVFEKLLATEDISAVYANEDYEPYAIKRDDEVLEVLNNKNVALYLFTDHQPLHPTAIQKKDNSPYTVFTPWKKQWLLKLEQTTLENYDVSDLHNVIAVSDYRFPAIEEMGFQNTGYAWKIALPPQNLLAKYEHQRDFPARDGTSRMSIPLRYGFVSIRQLLKHASDFDVYVSELGWRAFYATILYYFPHIVHRSFKAKYDDIPWRNNESEFSRWKTGETGYPIVDAGMRELAETGFMHNRVRMIVASFLTKHLLIDWRWGEAWFAEKLLDYELASNNGGWQWAAGSGCDAVPYFRIFNPTLQTQKFDPKLDYVRKWVSEVDKSSYVKPMVEHKYARERALETYKGVLKP
ncbi:MAG: deoxyribodipyrimidine photo-lyase [Salinivirgaceae bacterium]